MKVVFPLLLLVNTLVISLCSGCVFSEEEKETIINVEPEFSVDMYEEPGEPSQFIFRLKTIEVHDCLNDTINYSVQRLATKVNLNINSIANASDCIPGNQPITSSARVGQLGNGVYALQIGLKYTIFNKGKLFVSDQAFQISMEDENGFELIRSELKRVPNRLIWGYVAYQDQSAVGDLPQQFLAEVQAISQPVSLLQGSYSSFLVDENNVLKLPEAPPFPYFKTFYFKFDGDLQELVDLLDSYRSGTGGNSTEFKIFTWKGDTF